MVVPFLAFSQVEDAISGGEKITAVTFTWPDPHTAHTRDISIDDGSE